MKDVDLALSQISSIRAQVASSTRFQGIAPGFNLLTGLVALALGAFQEAGYQVVAGDDRRFVAVWSGFMVVASLIAALEAVSRARRLHGQLAPAMLNAAAQRALPFAVAAVVITWAIETFAPQAVLLLPGIWQILIGLLGFSAASNLASGMRWVAAWFLACGIVVLGLAGQAGALSAWMMGIPFAVGHTAVALILGRCEEGCDGRA